MVTHHGNPYRHIGGALYNQTLTVRHIGEFRAHQTKAQVAGGSGEGACGAACDIFNQQTTLGPVCDVVVWG